jgi:hypothetical protein
MFLGIQTCAVIDTEEVSYADHAESGLSSTLGFSPRYSEFGRLGNSKSVMENVGKRMSGLKKPCGVASAVGRILPC